MTKEQQSKWIYRSIGGLCIILFLLLFANGLYVCFGLPNPINDPGGSLKEFIIFNSLLAFPLGIAGVCLTARVRHGYLVFALAVLIGWITICARVFDEATQVRLRDAPFLITLFGVPALIGVLLYRFRPGRQPSANTGANRHAH